MFCVKCGHKIGTKNKFCKNCGAPAVTSDLLKKQKHTTFPKSERYIRKVFGFLFLIVVLPLGIFSIFARLFSLTPALLLISIYGLYLLRSRKHHLITDVIFAGLSYLFYALGGMGGGFGFPPVVPLKNLKGFFLTGDWSHVGIGFAPSIAYGLLVLSSIIILFFNINIFSLLTNIFAKIKPITNSSKRDLINGVSFLIIALVVFILPWQHKIQINSESPAGVMGPPPGNKTFLSAGGPELKSKVAFDLEKNYWQYEIELINTRQEEAVITAIRAKDIKGNNLHLAPPFTNNFQVVGGIKTEDKIIISPTMIPMASPNERSTQKPAILKISSQKPLILITWAEENGQFGGTIGFWK